MLPELVYILCGVTSLSCAALLFRGYKDSGVRLLLWSCLCFFALSAENIMLYVDKVIVQDVDLWAIRRGLGLIGVSLLLYGLVWDSK